MATTYSSGVVTAYGAALEGGFTGTYADFCQLMATLPTEYGNIEGSIAQPYSSSNTYPNIGTYVWHNGILYKNIVPITTAESWTEAHWTAAVLTEDWNDLRNILGSTTGNLLPDYNADSWTSPTSVSITRNGYALIINGTKENSGAVTITDQFVLGAGSYEFGVCDEDSLVGTGAYIQLFADGDVISQTQTHTPVTVPSATNATFRILLGAGSSFTNLSVKPMLFSGSLPSTYIPQVSAHDYVARNNVGEALSSISNLSNATAPAYSTSATYSVGDYVWHDGTLYRCTTAITTAEAWTAAHWTAPVLGDDVSDLKSAVNELDNIVNGGGGPITFGTVPDEYVEKNGTITPFRSWTRSDYIPVNDYTEVLFDNGATATQYNVFFDSNKDPISGSNFSIPANADGYVVTTNGAAYMMISQTTSKFAEISVYVNGTGGIAKQAIYSAEESGGVVTLKNDAGESVVQFPVGVSGDIEIPAYWEQSVSDTIAYVKTMRVNGYSNHIVITDQHYTDNKRHSAAIANRLFQSGFFEKIIMLGDIVDSGTTDGDNYKNLLADDYARNSANMLLVTGNHDVNLDKSVVFNDFVTGNSVVFCSNQYSYCWVWNDDIYKVRYIGIDRSSTYVQYAWLAKAIINAPEDYHICILTHYTMPANPAWTMNWETDIATALNTLLGMIGHPFVGYVCGHQHIDETDTLDNGGYLTTLICDRFDNQHYYQYYDYPTKVEGTDSEQALTILSVNPDTRDVRFYRVGSCCNSDHKNWGYSYKKVGVQAEIVPFEIIPGKYLSNGIERDSTDWDATGFIDISGATHVWIATDRTQNSWNMAYNFFYDANQQNPVNIGVNLSSAGSLTELTIPQGAAYLRMSHQTGTLNSLAIIVQK
jgi:hypothetical protein